MNMDLYWASNVKCLSCQNFSYCGSGIAFCGDYKKEEWTTEKTLQEVVNSLKELRKQLDKVYAGLPTGTSDAARFLQGKLMGLDDAIGIVNNFL